MISKSVKRAKRDVGPGLIASECYTAHNVRNRMEKA